MKKNKKKIFIDGEFGTTGLELINRLQRSNFKKQITVLRIDLQKRKDIVVKQNFYRESDLVVLCLPDESAKESHQLLLNINKKRKIPIKCLDASTAHRTDPKWVYGFPQIKNQKEKIKRYSFVTNPGCYATGLIALVRPLVEGNILPKEFPITAYGFSGYSGGGKNLIDHYRENYWQKIERKIINKQKNQPLYTSSWDLSLAPYALELTHKHLPEMQKYSLLVNSPFFQPSVIPSYKGMLVSIPLHIQQIKSLKEKSTKNISRSTIKKCYLKYYQKTNKINVLNWEEDILGANKFLDITKNNAADTIDLIVGGKKHFNLFARFNNLGKGAAGSAIENIRLMLNLSPDTENF